MRKGKKKNVPGFLECVCVCLGKEGGGGGHQQQLLSGGDGGTVKQ